METNNQSTNSPNLPKWMTPRVLWSVIGILLVVVVVGSVALWQVQKNEEESLRNTLLNSGNDLPIFSGSNNPSDPTSTWKTYTNSAENLEFMYPNTFGVTKDANNYPAILIKSDSSTIVVNFPASHVDASSFSGTAVQAHFGSNFAYQVDGTEDHGTGKVRRIYLQKPNGDFMTIELFGSFEKDLPVLKQILSTFKFTESKTTITPTATPAKGGISGILIVTTCGGAYPGTCTDLPGSNLDIGIADAKGVIQNFTAGSDGGFKITLSPREYTIKQPQRYMMEDQSVTVVTGQYAPVSINYRTLAP